MMEETKRTPTKSTSQTMNLNSNSSSKKDAIDDAALAPLTSSDHMVNLIVKKLLID